MLDDLFVVVGLGNPGPGYAANRHNAGFMVVDSLAARISGGFASHRTRADVVEGRLGVEVRLGVEGRGGGSVGPRVVLAKPRCYMNESGGPVSALVKYFKVDLDRLVVVHDELDIPFGEVRIKAGGGDNGHNGLRSITTSLGGRDYLRVRFGIGRPPGRQDPADFVLRDFPKAEREEVALTVGRAADAVEMLIREGVAETQNVFHAPTGGTRGG